MREPTTRGEPEDPQGRTPQIQFRPGSFFQRRLEWFAKNWGVAVNEAAKRLALLGASGLSIDDCDLVSGLGEVAGEQGDFGRCCERIFVALDSANQARRDAGLPPLTQEAKSQFIAGLIASWKPSNTAPR
jgi:hypothetical protein